MAICVRCFAESFGECTHRERGCASAFLVLLLFVSILPAERRLVSSGKLNEAIKFQGIGYLSVRVMIKFYRNSGKFFCPPLFRFMEFNGSRLSWFLGILLWRALIVSPVRGWSGNFYSLTTRI